MYHILYAILYLLSLLPWRVLYVLSDGVAFLIYSLLGYRKKVVMNNLLIAFPKKTEAERAKIAKEFYRNLCDSFIETIKLLSISDRSFAKRMTANYEVVNELYKTGQSVHLMCGHFFHWEYIALSIPKFTPYTMLTVYMPVTNKAFDRLMLKIRSKYNSVMLSTFTFKTTFHQYKSQQYAMGLAADQAGDPAKGYWIDFFGKPAPFVPGPEKSSQLNNTAVVFTNFYKVRRGYYHGEFTLITTRPRDTERGELTKQYVRFVEACVRQRPANYLWSHRRWKWEFRDEYRKRLLQ